MPHYRITIKLENESVKEYFIEVERNQNDFVLPGFSFSLGNALSGQ
ncbi:MAG: hypothetical protein ACTHK8_01960 [Ginsengibacter sp.]